jgi:hypothetical protein
MSTSVWPVPNQPWGPNCVWYLAAQAPAARSTGGVRGALWGLAGSAWVSGAGEPPGEGRSRAPSGVRGCYSPRVFGDSGGDRGNRINRVRRAPQRRVRLGAVGFVRAVTASCGGLCGAHSPPLCASARRDA